MEARPTDNVLERSLTYSWRRNRASNIKQKKVSGVGIYHKSRLSPRAPTGHPAIRNQMPASETTCHEPSSSRKNIQLLPQKEQIGMIPHPYLERKHPKLVRTLAIVKKMEDEALKILIEKSKWKPSPFLASGTGTPFECYERCPESQRVVTLNIMVLNVKEQFDRVLSISKYAGYPKLESRPAWSLSKMIAVLDQVSKMSLFRCRGFPMQVGFLTNLRYIFLTCCSNINLARAIYASREKYHIGCNLDKLELISVLDCEYISPKEFRCLPGLKTLIYAQTSKVNNRAKYLGRCWVKQLTMADPSPESSNRHAQIPGSIADHPRIQFGFRLTLQSLTFSGAGLTNHDLGTILWKILPLFPALETLDIRQNPEIDSLKRAIFNPEAYESSDERKARMIAPIPTNLVDYTMENGSQQQSSPSFASKHTSSYDFSSVSGRKSSSIQVLKELNLWGSKINWKIEELDCAIHLLQSLCPRICILGISQPSYLFIENRGMRLLAKERVNKINYLLVMNRTNAFSLTGVGVRFEYKTSSSNRDLKLIYRYLESTTTRSFCGTNPPPDSLWPRALARVFSDDYRNLIGSDIEDRKKYRFDIAYHFLRYGSVLSSGQTFRYKRKRAYYQRKVKRRVRFPP